MSITRRRLVWVSLFALAAAGCSKPAPSAGNQTNAAAGGPMPAAAKPLNGWGAFKFGMPFDDALSAQPGVRWTAESFRECQDQMPLKGCALAPSEDSYVPLTAGVALLPRLSFNEDGKLVTIDMTKILRGKIEPRQCERVHGQLLDYLDSEWGRGRSRSTSNLLMAKRATPKGRSFWRTAGAASVFVFDVEDFSERPDGRKVTIISHYTAASEYSPADCWVSIYYDAPKSLERPPIQPATLEPMATNESEGDAE